jgi:hypothetical protein
MPWYWSDDLARVLLAAGKIEPRLADRLVRTPVGIRRPELDVETAALALQDDDNEIPLAA